MRLDGFKYPPMPECSDDLCAIDLPDAIEGWERECNNITIANLQSVNSALTRQIEELKASQGIQWIKVESWEKLKTKGDLLVCNTNQGRITNIIHCDKVLGYWVDRAGRFISNPQWTHFAEINLPEKEGGK